MGESESCLPVQALQRDDGLDYPGTGATSVSCVYSGTAVRTARTSFQSFIYALSGSALYPSVSPRRLLASI